MITLRQHQSVNADKLVAAITAHGCGIDASDTGTGKTFTALEVARRTGRHPFVVSPLSVGPGWQRKADAFGVPLDGWLNYEKARSRHDWITNLDPRSSLVVFDEAHRVKSPTSLQAKTAKAVSDACIPILFSSATPFSSPLETRALLHATRQIHWRNWENTLPMFDCYRMQWIRGKPWKWKGTEKSIMHLREMLRDVMVATHYGDLPEFPDRIIETVLVPTSPKDAAMIDELRAGFEPGNIGATMVERAAVEMVRVPAMAEMARDLMETGHSVVAFFNFTAPLLEFARLTKAEVIHGETPGVERTRIMDRFQASLTPTTLAANGVAASEGIDLHDTVGIPRVTLISPPYSASVIRQEFGRTHRDGAKSPAIIRIVFAAGTVEETGVVPRIQQRLANLNTLTDLDLY